jgi:hypothetical protein
VICRSAPDGQSFGQRWAVCFVPGLRAITSHATSERKLFKNRARIGLFRPPRQGWLGTGRCLYEIVNDACRISPSTSQSAGDHLIRPRSNRNEELSYPRLGGGVAMRA